MGAAPPRCSRRCLEEGATPRLLESSSAGLQQYSWHPFEVNFSSEDFSESDRLAWPAWKARGFDRCKVSLKKWLGDLPAAQAARRRVCQLCLHASMAQRLL